MARAASWELGPDVTPRSAVSDKSYASKTQSQRCAFPRCHSGDPAQNQREDKPSHFAKAIYRGRARIEQAVGKLKCFKRLAMRCEKTKRSFSAIGSIAAAFNLFKSVHTAWPRHWRVDHS